LAQYPIDGDTVSTIDELIAAADEAMYKDKRLKRSSRQRPGTIDANIATTHSDALPPRSACRLSISSLQSQSDLRVARLSADKA